MDCAIPAAAAAVGPASSPDVAGASSLCEQGRHFSNLVNAPDEQSTRSSAVVDTYVTASQPVPSGGVVLTDAIERMRSFSLPGLDAQSTSSVPADTGEGGSLGDLAAVMEQTITWQREILRVSMMNDMVASMNQGVRTLFQQQG